jgi:hypothetical protein
MTTYISYQLPITEGQRKKIARAYETKSPVSVRLTGKQLLEMPNISILLTKRQVDKMEKVKSMGIGVVLKLSVAQLRAQKKEGGFLPAILVPIITALATGALSATAGYAANKGLNAIEKAIEKKKKKKEEGSGLFPLGSGLFPLGTLGSRP